MLAFVGCTDNNPKPNETTTESDVFISTTEADTTELETESETETVTESATETTTESTTEETTESTTESTTANLTTTESAKTTKKETTTKKESTTKKTTTTKKETTTKKSITVPSSKADIVLLYNKATERVKNAKPGYKKTTNTVLSNLSMGALARIDVVRTTIGEFLGEGKTTKTVTKGKYDSKDLMVSKLTANDVTSATCKLSSDGKYFEISITVRNETNPQKSSSSLGKFTNDYKDNNEIKAGLKEAGASLDSITMNTTSVTIKAKINVENFNFVSLNHSIKMNAVLTNVKYSIAKVSKASADLSTTIDYTDFKY